MPHRDRSAAGALHDDDADADVDDADADGDDAEQRVMKSRA